jgi:tripartite-type tricarboxylate transporter receptor subunit TctC
MEQAEVAMTHDINLQSIEHAPHRQRLAMPPLHWTNDRTNIRSGREGIMGMARLLPLVALALLASPARAQDDYPNRPIRVILPNGPGAGVDTAARVTAAAAERFLGQKFIIENKPGGSMRIGTSQVAKAAPDGYTLLFCPPAPIVVSQFFPPKLDFDPERDFRPVVVGMFQPVLLIVRPSLGVKSVDEFVAYAKKNPGKISFGVQGIGGEMHLSLEHFKKTAGMEITPVPYNSGAQAIVDLLADRLDAMFLVIPPIKQHVEAGKLLALATLNAKRVQALPDIPTMAELGRPEMTGAIWFGYLAPAKTPDTIITKLVHAFQELRSDQALDKRVTEMGAELSLAGPDEFGKIIDDDRRRYGNIVAEGHLADQK